jgi:hypothetical protein
MKSDLISNTLENDRPYHDCTAACVITQQYSSVTSISLRFNSRKEKFGIIFKNSLFYLFLISKHRGCLNLRKFKLRGSV